METTVQHQRAVLAACVYQYVSDHTESFEEAAVGADLAYLLGAILQGHKCAWGPSRPIVKILRDWSEWSAVAPFIDILTDEDEDAAQDAVAAAAVGIGARITAWTTAPRDSVRYAFDEGTWLWSERSVASANATDGGHRLLRLALRVESVMEEPADIDC